MSRAEIESFAHMRNDNWRKLTARETLGKQASLTLYYAEKLSLFTKNVP